MNIHTKDDGYKTFDEWQKLGYKPKKSAYGMLFLINKYSEDYNRYYSEKEVEEMEEWEWQNIARRAAKEKQERLENEWKNEDRWINCGKKTGKEEGKKEQFLRDLNFFGYKIVKVYVTLDRYKEILYYLVPSNVMPGYIGKFQYDSNIVEGIVVDEKINIDELARETFFPDRIKKMLE